ncbi:hypothetical protein E4U39_007084, partial [Claviceps sp. Clav50 group G5]
FSSTDFSSAGFSSDAFSSGALSPAALSPAALSPAALSPAALSPAALSPAAFSPGQLLPSPPAMDRRGVDRLTVSTESWFTEDSWWSSGDEEIHGVMDGAGDHDDQTIQDDAHIASEQHHHTPLLSDGVRYRASHAGRHRLTTTTPVVSPPASPSAIESRVSGRPFPTTVHMSSISARREYLVKLCRAIIMYGAPPHQLEEYMSMSSLPLEIEGQFSYVPDCMTIIFARSTAGPAEGELVRVREGIDLGRLQDAHDINMDVAHDRLGVEEAARRLDGVSGARPKSEVWFLIL